MQSFVIPRGANIKASQSVFVYTSYYGKWSDNHKDKIPTYNINSAITFNLRHFEYFSDIFLLLNLPDTLLV